MSFIFADLVRVTNTPDAKLAGVVETLQGYVQQLEAKVAELQAHGDAQPSSPQ